jgi:N-acetyl-gamma-glutamyl-phosphate reductase
VSVTFTPTLAPMTRGILATQYVDLAHAGVTVRGLVAEARRYFAGSPSVAVLDPGVLPDTLWVRGSNRATWATPSTRGRGRVVAMCAIDNLVKGAAGQAIQCMNLLAGFDEGEGLRGAAVFP